MTDTLAPRACAAMIAPHLGRAGDHDLMRLVIWANQANATQDCSAGHRACETPDSPRDDAHSASGPRREIDRLGAALAAQSINKALPCSFLGGLAQFIEPWLGQSLRSRLTRCESDSASGALLMIRKAVQDQPWPETGSG